MTLQQLIYFNEVSKTLHFKRASENLFVSQSSLSHAIQTLERELGTPLFIRENGKQIALTDYGLAFLPYVKKVLSELEDGKEILDKMISTNEGKVNIAYGYINGCVIIPKLFKEFYQNENNANIQLRSFVNHGGDPFVEERLLNGTADIAFSSYTFEEDESIDAVKIFDQLLYIALPVDHPLANHESLTIEDIKDEYLIAMNGSMSLYSSVLKLYSDENINPKMIDSLSDWTAQMNLIACNRGISIMPKVPYSSDGVKFVLLDNPNNSRPIYILWMNDKNISPAAKHFRDFSLEYFSGDLKI